MKILRDYTFTWWQMGIFKLCLLAIGIAIGAYWQDIFLPYATALVAMGVILGIYLAFAAFRK